jgi:hypothetical protein
MTSRRMTTVVLTLLAATLAGCTLTARAPAGAGSAAAPGAGYVVCSGGHASRFPEREAVGQVCRPSTSLQAIY